MITLSRASLTISPRVSRALLWIAFSALLIHRPTFAADAHDSTRWEKSIAEFEEQDRDDPPKKKGVLFVGSSSIRLWKLDKSFPKLQAINRGFGGSQIADSVNFADRIIIKHQPMLVFLYAGDNDVASGKSAERVTNDFRRFVQVIHEKLPKTRIGFIAIKPSIKRWALVDKMREANRRIQEICEQDERLIYVDIDRPMLGDDGLPRKKLFAKDGLHLNEAGYEVWAEQVRLHLPK